MDARNSLYLKFSHYYCGKGKIFPQIFPILAETPAQGVRATAQC